MQWVPARSKMNSIPAFWPRDLRYIRPCARVGSSAATSARMRCMPAVSCTTGSCCASAGVASSIDAIRKCINEKGRVCALPFSSLGSGLLLHLVFFLRVFLRVFLGGLFLGVFFRGLLLGLLLVLHLRAGVRRREGGSANCRKHRGDNHGQQLVHFLLLVSVRTRSAATDGRFPEGNNALRTLLVDLPRVMPRADSRQNPKSGLKSW